MKIYSDEDLLAPLRTFAKINDRPPSKRECDASPDLPCFDTLRTRFGSFNNAILSAGLVPRQANPRYTDEELKTALRIFVSENGHVPSSFEYGRNYKKGTPSPRTIIRRFGSFYNALLSSGIKISLLRYSLRSMAQYLYRFADFFAGLFRVEHVDT